MRAVIFDFDGVIVDTEPLHEQTLLAAAEAVGMSFTHERFRTRYVGRSDLDILPELAAEHARRLSPGELVAIAADKTRRFVQMLATDAMTPYTATLDLIRAAARRWPVGVCSGSRLAEVEPILRSLELLPLVGAIVTADQVERNKPDPAPYLLAARRLAVGPERCVVLEDTPTGVRSALAAGMRVAAVCHTLPAHRLDEAHAVFASTADLDLESLLSV